MLVAQINDYNIHTQADTKDELEVMINDLLYGYFDIPVELQGEVKYKFVSPVAEATVTVEEPNRLQVWSTPFAFGKFSFA